VAQRQVNIRLAEEDVAVLEAAAFADDDALPDLVRSILLERIASFRRDPEIDQILAVRAARAKRRAERAAGVSSLSDRRQRKKGDDPA
jgi:hypothetical protein